MIFVLIVYEKSLVLERERKKPRDHKGHEHRGADKGAARQKVEGLTQGLTGKPQQKERRRKRRRGVTRMTRMTRMRGMRRRKT
jgi:hypothetical protein